MAADIYSGGLAYKEQDKPIENMDANSPPLIIIGQGTSYEKITIYERERLNRLLLVGIKNSRSNTFLSNCKLHLQHAWSDGTLHDILLADTFDLYPGGERFVQVAAYTGSSIPENRDKRITLCMTQHGYFSYEHMPPVDKKHIVTLRLEAHENIVVKENCVLWVDENDRVRLEKA